MKRQLLIAALFGLLLTSCGDLGSSSGPSSIPESGSSSTADSDLSSLPAADSSTPVEPVIATCRITFGTTADSQVSTIVGPDSYLQSGESIVASLSGTNAYAPAEGGNNALRLGSSSKAGELTLGFDSSYVLESIDVYCYQYGNDTARLGLKLGGEVYAAPAAVDWTSVPTLGSDEGSNAVSFDGLASEGEVSSLSLYNENGRERVNVCEIAISYYLEGAPSGGNGESSSPSQETPESSSEAPSSSVPSGQTGGSLQEELSALSSSVRSYYAKADLSKSGASLKSEFTSIIHSHTNVGYNGLWNVYEDSDDDGKGNYWDMYSNIRHRINDDKCGNYGGEGDCVNREHTIPQSVFDERSPMVADAHQVIPTDGYVNGRRSNYPFGEVGTATYTSGNGSKLGKCSYPGYSGTVFEPIDEYKGDFARIHFYFVTCYASEMKSGWGSYASFNYSSALGLSNWAQSMLLSWAEEDPVSPKEIERNNAVYSHQKNRNPFVDFPSLAEAIFG